MTVSSMVNVNHVLKLVSIFRQSSFDLWVLVPAGAIHPEAAQAARLREGQRLQPAHLPLIVFTCTNQAEEARVHNLPRHRGGAFEVLVDFCARGVQ